MSKPSPEQQRITELERALEVAMYWLLRAHASDDAARGDYPPPHAYVDTFLCNHGLAPESKQAKALLKRPMEAYHFELEKAVKRATR